MLRKFIVASAALVALGGTAFAADLPTTKGPAVYTPPPLAYSWTGAYIGGQAGYEWGRTNTSTFSGAGVFLLGLPGYNDTGFVGGAHAGYNYQIDQFVLGVEGDVEGSTFQGATAAAPFTYLSTRIPLQGSLRGRVGYAWDRALIYATGGLALGDIHNVYISPAGGAVGALVIPGVNAQFWTVRPGWTVGGGLEYAIDPNWSVRAEYRYTDYGSFSEGPLTAAGTSGRVRIYDNAVRAGFSYKFDWAQPIVSKY